MSSFTIYSRRIVTAAAGIGVLGTGLATSAFAAPAALPNVAELPIPVLTRPLDASGGVLGIPRGSIPGIATPDLQQVPMANQLPDLEIVPLPAAGASSPSTTTAPSAPADTDAEPAPAADAVTPSRTSGGSALAGLDDTGFMSGLMKAVPAG